MGNKTMEIQVSAERGPEKALHQILGRKNMK